MNKQRALSIALTVVLAAVLGIAALLALSEQKSQIRQLQHNLAHARVYQPIRIDTVRIYTGDTASLRTVDAITDEVRSLRRQHLIDKQLLKDMEVKIRDLKAYNTQAYIIHDTVKAAPVTESPDTSSFAYEDRWTSLLFHLSDTSFVYSVRDSLITSVERVPRHRFLWWRWGTKGYRVKTLNFNPHVTFTSNQYIIPSK